MSRPNFKPNTIFCRDNLLILEKINSECVDLIYADPPFNKKKKFTAPIGSSAEGAEFKDYFVMSDVKEQWIWDLKETNGKLYSFLQGVKETAPLLRNYNYAYLIYMAMRIIECHRILKNTGSFYLHCDHTMSHYLKLVLDLIFGEKNLRNEIVWFYPSMSRAIKHFPRKHDTIFFYTKSKDYVLNADAVREPYDEKTVKRYEKPVVFPGGYVAKKNPKGRMPYSVWQIPPVRNVSKENTGYPTQKPLKLLRRIIRASSNPGNLVLDPFCGCATACVAAQQLQRQWVGIDVSELAWTLVQKRIKKEVPKELQGEKRNFRVDVPTITAAHPNRSKYVYVISCGSHPGKYKVGIATNPKTRLGSYNTGSPERDYGIEHQVKTEYYAEIEARIHKDFDADHEWVTGSLQKIKNRIERYIKNPEKL